MILDALTLEDVQLVRTWRNADLKALRTPYMLTRKMQGDFYYEQVCNRNANSRWWAIKATGDESFVKRDEVYGDLTYLRVIGMGGLENIVWENRNAEISLIIDPELRGKGYGAEAVDMILKMGFNYLDLHAIYAEVYWCNEEGIAFWQKMKSKYNAVSSILPFRKYWNGHYYDSDWITFMKGKENGEV